MCLKRLTGGLYKLEVRDEFSDRYLENFANINKV